MVKTRNKFMNEHDCEKAFCEEIVHLFPLPMYTLCQESHHQITSDTVLSAELNGNRYKLANFTNSKYTSCCTHIIIGETSRLWVVQADNLKRFEKLFLKRSPLEISVMLTSARSPPS